MHNQPTRTLKIVSGGQTGVDRAALDIALELGFAAGGWVPHGRLAEDGPLPAKYPVRETPEPEYAVRTEYNVRDSDGTLILHQGPLTGGTLLTYELAKRYRKPCCRQDLLQGPSVDEVYHWVVKHNIQVLNVAGPRESGQPGIYSSAQSFLWHFLSLVVGWCRAAADPTSEEGGTGTKTDR